MMLSLIFAASITLATPENGATYDTHSPCVNEFLENFEKRGEKPPRPPLTEGEIKQRDKMNERYEAWVKAGRPKEAGGCLSFLFLIELMIRTMIVTT